MAKASNQQKQQPKQQEMPRSVMWFEPQKPSQLSVAVAAQGRDGIAVYSLSAESGVGAPGVGCTEHESTALLQILTAHEEHFREQEQQQQPQSNSGAGMKDLSQQYRAAVRECCFQWGDQIQEMKEKGEADEETIQEEFTNLSLLKDVYVIIHLSEIFLPLLSPSWENGDPFDKPGYVTADTVRFLRCHLVDYAQMFFDTEPLREMVDSEYPEQFQDHMYWRFLEKLVLRGHLESAWDLVKAHSLYRAVMEPDELPGDQQQGMDAHQQREIANAFRSLQVLLLRAPLPGGRKEGFDHALDHEEMYDDGVEDMEYDDDFDVMASDYKLWEVSDGSSRVIAGDVPLLFSSDEAMRTFQKWKEQVSRVRRTSRLIRKIPEFDNILAILLGEFTNIIFDSWSEQLCSELLYKTPNLRPRNISSRASALMQKFASKAVTDEAILAIMDGEAGKAIDEIFINGGCSGAALPSTLVSLYFNLFMEYGIIDETPELQEVKVDRLNESSAAIVSSLAGSKFDIGVQSAVRLLMPYAERGESPQLVAMIACILYHYAPSTDQCARTMISLCKPLVEQKSMQVLDGCTDVLLCLYREHTQNDDTYLGAVILLDGIELEALVFPQPELGACYRVLASKCHAASLHLLRSLVETHHGNLIFDPDVTYAARAMKKAFEAHAVDAFMIPEVKQLVGVLGVFDSLMDKEYFKAGSQIVECLDMRIEANIGVACSSSSLSLHPLLIKAAHMLLALKAEEPTEPDDEPPEASLFDKKGMTLLLQTLDRLRVLSSLSPEEIGDMTKSFMKALAQTFEAENAKKRLMSQIGACDQNEDIKGIRSADLHKYDSGKQERVVAEMLNF